MKGNRVLEVALLEIHPRKGKSIVDQIIKNSNTLGYLTPDYLTTTIATQALLWAFAWDDSPEGDKYWNTIFKEVMDWEDSKETSE